MDGLSGGVSRGDGGLWCGLLWGQCQPCVGMSRDSGRGAVCGDSVWCGV